MWVSFLYVITYALSGLGLFFTPSQISGRWLTVALLYITIGLLSMWFGYTFGGAGKVRRPRHPASNLLAYRSRYLARPSVILALYMLGFAARLYSIKKGLYGYVSNLSLFETSLAFQQWLAVASMLTKIALTIAWIEILSNKMNRLGRGLFYCLILIEVFFGLVSGMKGAVIGVLFPIVFLYYYFKRRLPWKLIGATVIVLALLIPINASYRDMVALGKIDTRSIASPLSGVVSATFKAFSSAQSTNLLRQDVDWFVRRFSFLHSINAIINQTPQKQPFWYGRYYWQIPALVFIPRAVWVNKPCLNYGKWFAITYLGYPQETRTSVAVTLVGDLYLNFGVVGVILGMFLLGLCFYFLYQKFRSSSSKVTLLVYTMIFPLITSHEIGLVEISVAAIRLAIITAIIGFIVYHMLGDRSKR